MKPWRLLVPLDFSDRDLAALEQAAALSSTLGAAVTLLHVVRPGRALASEARAHSHTQLEARRDLFWPQARHIEVAVALGDPKQVIVREAGVRSACLILLSTRRGRGLLRLLRRGTAAHVLREAPCPVLIARTPGAPRMAGEAEIG